MKRFIATIGLTASVMASPLVAGEVNQASVNTFSGGNAAVASEVNQNFTALINAIDDNAQRITQLESDLTSLAVSGKSYKIYIHRVEIEDRGTDGVAEEFTALRGEELTATFEQDNTVTVTGGEETNADVDSVAGLSVTNETFSASQGLTWQRNGNVVTINDANVPDGGLTFLVAPGARTLVYLERDQDTADTNYHNELVLGIQASSP